MNKKKQRVVPDKVTDLDQSEGLPKPEAEEFAAKQKSDITIGFKLGWRSFEGLLKVLNPPDALHRVLAVLLGIIPAGLLGLVLALLGAPTVVSVIAVVVLYAVIIAIILIPPRRR